MRAALILSTGHNLQAVKVSNLRQFYTQLLSLSKQNLVETSYSELEKLTGENILFVGVKIQKLRKIGVIESFFNAKAYDKNDYRLLIGLSSPEYIDRLFKNGGEK